MEIDKDILKQISNAASSTSNPERAESNLQRFFEQNPENRSILQHLSVTAKLFAASQFLANYCIAHAEELELAIKDIKKELTKKLLQARAKNDLVFSEGSDINDIMKALRLFKKRYLLRISLRDITGEANIQESMDELTFLSEIVISAALEWSFKFTQLKHGTPADSVISLIALGKLGGEELNYSSDIDLIAVYENDTGETPGVLNPSGIMFNKISSHEYYCKIVELFSKLLSAQTEDGVAYRVDLRLRPQGQKGDLALPLKAYRTYYESWGRTWERMVMIRARPVAGDINLGKAFLDTIRPFVWRETLDYTEIEEIRGLKKRIDSTFSRDDIKRGYGGIREAEFFVQTFQLLYAAKNSSLKSYRILNAIQALKWMKIIPDEDLTTLWENYLYLRRVEQYLQMKEDLQTHTLPTAEKDMTALSKMMDFQSVDDFLADLRIRRMQIKSMYNSLLGTQEDVDTEALNILEGGLKDFELTGYLSFRKVKNPKLCIINLKKIRDHMRVFRTMQERSISRKVIPQLIETGLISEDPDRAIAGIESLMTSFGIKTAHLTALMEQREMLTGIVKILSLSSYLSRIFLSNSYYLNMLIEKWTIFKTLKNMEDTIGNAVMESDDFTSRLTRFRRLEEVRLGMLFLQNIMTTEDLFKNMSYLAEAIISIITNKYSEEGLSVIALGKLGGREMTFGSDLDIIFISETQEASSTAEMIMKDLTAYTDMGPLYEVDTRLRPDGSKGFLVKDIEGYKNYYLNKAQNWEIQALLKARPVGGDQELGHSFMNMAKDVILQKGSSIKRSDISTMRERIVKELAHEQEGIDVKLGPGGIGEIEFFTQYLQLNNAGNSPEVLGQNTPEALDRLCKKGLLDNHDKNILTGSYEYYRKLETFLRLNEEQYIAEDSDLSEISAKFMKHGSHEEFISHLINLRNNVIEIINRY